MVWNHPKLKLCVKIHFLLKYLIKNLYLQKKYNDSQQLDS